MLYASNVAIPPDLEASLRSIGKSGVQGVQGVYAPLTARQQAEAGVRGQRPGANSYGPQRLGVQQGLDTGALEASLGNEAGKTAYQNQLAQREYGQQEQLAKETGNLNSLSALEQVLNGVGAVGKTGATYYGMKGGGKGLPKNSNYYGYDLPSGGGTAYDINNPGPLDIGYNWSSGR